MESNGRREDPGERPLTIAMVVMLTNMKSPETYFQAAFRVQSPWTVSNDAGETEIVKKRVLRLRLRTRPFIAHGLRLQLPSQGR